MDPNPWTKSLDPYVAPFLGQGGFKDIPLAVRTRR